MIIEQYLEKGIIKKIVETEIERYTHFLTSSYKENLEHCKFNLEKFPRWSIISGYYAMHDITKLFLVKKFQIKIDIKVHKTVLRITEEITKDKEILNLLKVGYEEFTKMASDLTEAREERQQAQYYRGTEFLEKKYKEKAPLFLNNTVNSYLTKINSLLENDI